MPSCNAAWAQEIYETVMELDCSLPMADVCVGYSDHGASVRTLDALSSKADRGRSRLCLSNDPVMKEVSVGNTAKRAARTFVLSRRRISRGGGDRNSLSPLIPRNLLILLNGRNYKNSEFPEPRTRRAHGTASLMGHWQAVREKDSAIDANTATTNIDMEFAGSGGSFGCMGGFRRAGRRRSSAHFVVG